MHVMQVSKIYYLQSFKNINLVIEKIMLLIPATTSQPLGSLQVPQTCKNKHLYGDHVKDWVTSCESLKIPITATAALAAISKFHNELVATPLEAEQPQYSKEAFIDAIVDFVVGDDQVCH